MAEYSKVYHSNNVFCICIEIVVIVIVVIVVVVAVHKVVTILP